MNLFKEEAFQGIIMDAVEYDVIVENLDVLQEAILSKRLLLIESAKDKKEVAKSAEKYVKDVKEFVHGNTEKAEKLRKVSKILAYITLGSTIAMMLISIGGTTAAAVAGSKAAAAAGGTVFAKSAASIAASTKVIHVTEILVLISMLVSMISSIATYITGDIARKVVLKLKPVKKQLEIYRSRTDSHTVQDKLDKLIIKIETVTDKVSDDTATERVSSHSF